MPYREGGKEVVRYLVVYFIYGGPLYCRKGAIRRCSFRNNLWLIPSISEWYSTGNYLGYGRFCTKNTWNFLSILIKIFLVFDIWSILYSKFLENIPNCHHIWYNYWFLLRFCSWPDQNMFQNILRKLKKVSLKNKCRNFFFWLKLSEAYAKKKCIKIRAKK